MTHVTNLEEEEAATRGEMDWHRWWSSGAEQNRKVHAIRLFWLLIGIKIQTCRSPGIKFAILRKGSRGKCQLWRKKNLVMHWWIAGGRGIWKGNQTAYETPGWGSPDAEPPETLQSRSQRKLKLQIEVKWVLSRKTPWSLCVVSVLGSPGRMAGD